MAHACMDCGVGLWDDLEITCTTCTRARERRMAGRKNKAEPTLKLFICRVRWTVPRIKDSHFSILDTSKAGANSTMLSRLTQLGESTSNIQVNGIVIHEVKGPFTKGYIIHEEV